MLSDASPCVKFYPADAAHFACAGGLVHKKQGRCKKRTVERNSSDHRVRQAI